MARAMGLSFISFVAGNSFNSIEKIGNIVCPILIIHGTEDQVIPFEMGERIYKEAKAKKQFVRIEGAGHNNISEQLNKDYWLQIYKFLKQENTE